uniref:Uncharacterized protein n=1 Tax=Cohnella candidum TaxID=2674991 RepID=A0A3G3K239_9BACL|nr:hypothetical protein EAV92_19805 [Cohnella candidum]
MTSEDGSEVLNSALFRHFLLFSRKILSGRQDFFSKEQNSILRVLSKQRESPPQAGKRIIQRYWEEF